MHKWIMESEHLSNMLYDLYKHNGDDYKKATNANEKQQYKDYQIRVCQVYRYDLFLFHSGDIFSVFQLLDQNFPHAFRS